MPRSLFLVVAVAGALGLAVGFLLGDRHGSEASTAPAVPSGASIAEVGRLRADNRDLVRKLRAETVRAEAAEKALADRRPAGTTLPPGASGGASSAKRTGSPFFADDYGGALRHVDWQTVGGNLHGMVKTLEQGLPYIEKKQKIPDDIAHRIRELNSPVLAAAIKVRDHLPGDGVLGKFTSAPFMLNAIASALEAAGLPLDDGQTSRILAFGQDLAARDATRRAGYGADSFALTRLLDEVDLKGRFFDEVFSVLTPAQAAALSPEPVRGRVRLDLFSSALLFGGRLQVVKFEDETKLTAVIAGRVAKAIGITGQQWPQVKPIFERFTADIPRDLLYAQWNSLDERGMVTVACATGWGRQFVRLFTDLAAAPALDAKQKQALHGIGNFLVCLAADRGE